MSTPGFVYAIESGDAVKIGYARDPVRRLSELNVGSPGSHRLLGFIEGTKDQERELIVKETNGAVTPNAFLNARPQSPSDEASAA